MNPALDKYYESIIQMKGGKKKSKRSGKKKSSGKKKRSGKKKKSSKKKRATTRSNPRVVDHTIGRSRLDQILGGIPILSQVNPFLTSLDTYGAYSTVMPGYTDVVPEYSTTASAAAVAAPMPSMATGPINPGNAEPPVSAFELNQPGSNFGAVEHPVMGAMGHPTMHSDMGMPEMGAMEHPMLGHNDNNNLPSINY